MKTAKEALNSVKDQTIPYAKFELMQAMGKVERAIEDAIVRRMVTVELDLTSLAPSYLEGIVRSLKKQGYKAKYTQAMGFMAPGVLRQPQTLLKITWG